MEYLELILEAETIAESLPKDRDCKRFLRKFYKYGITDEVVDLAKSLVHNKKAV